MGTSKKGKIGYDSNAWIWETANMVEWLARLNVTTVYSFAGRIQDILRYF